MGAYIIVIRGRKRVRRFVQDEILGKKLFPIIREKFIHDEVHFGTTNFAETPPPDNFISRYPFQTWCPSCGKATRYRKNPDHDCYNCSVCGLSDQEFWVKKYNGIWAMEKLTDGKKHSRASRKAVKHLVQSKGEEAVKELTEDPVARKRRLRKERRQKREQNKNT